MGKLIDTLNGLFKKADDTSKRYEVALERKQEEMIKIQSELAERQSVLKDLHKMALLGDVSEATYQKEAERVEKLQNKITEIQTEMTLISDYQNEDVKQILADIEANKQELTSERQKQIYALKQELLQVKYAYLSRLVEARKQHSKIMASERKVEALKAKLGLKNRLDYMQDADSALSAYSVAGGGYIHLQVDTHEVHDALYYGRIDSQLARHVKTEN